VKKKKSKNQKLVKGVSSSMLLSVGIHGALFFVLGGFIVFKVVNQPPVEFVVPQPVARPQIPPKKPRVKVQKSLKQASPKRVAVENPVATDLLALPLGNGLGDEIGGSDLGGFQLVPDVSGMVSPYGTGQSYEVGNDFEGTMYAFNYTRDKVYAEMDATDQIAIMVQFLENNWSPSVFHNYYRAPKKLYTTHFLIPPAPSGEVPRAFSLEKGLDKIMDPPRWVIHYKGKISNKAGGRFRFWGYGGDLLYARVNKKLVFHGGVWGSYDLLSPAGWELPDGPNYEYALGQREAFVGTWFELKPGEEVEMEVLIGEFGFGTCAYYLLVEEEGEDAYYSHRSEDGMPILPAFKTAPYTAQMKKKIQYSLMPQDADLDGGPLFNVY
jgi:hypothetical protein